MEKETQRRRAAIVMAAVVGYFSTIHRNEDGTRTVFNKPDKNFFRPLSRTYGERIIKTMADALLMALSLVVTAVTRAVELQKQMLWHVNEAESPDLRVLQFRITANLGDIIAEGTDRHGGGLKVAARLQGIADPGGACISEAVIAQVQGKSDVDFADSGNVKPKRLKGEHQVYQWSPGRIAAHATALTIKEPDCAWGCPAGIHRGAALWDPQRGSRTGIFPGRQIG
jgi:class 3 adenylate cyclase